MKTPPCPGALRTCTVRWTNNQAPIHQRLTMVEYGHVVLMLTFTAPGTLSDTQREQIRAVIQSLQLRDPV